MLPSGLAGRGCHVVEQGGFGRFRATVRAQPVSTPPQYRTEHSGSFKVSYIMENFQRISYYLFTVFKYKNKILLTVTLLGTCFSSVPRPRARIHSSCAHFPPWFSFVLLSTFLSSLDASCEH